MAEYRTIITELGQTKLATAAVSGPQVNFTEMAVGDSNGVGYDPSEQQTDLVNERYRGSLGEVSVQSGGVIVLAMTVPISSGGYHIREAGVFDSDGDMIAIVRIADRYKPLPSSGQADDLTIELQLDVGNVGNVTWTIDPARKDRISAQLTPDYRSVEGFVNSPPTSPSLGKTWVVGTAPDAGTAFAGHANELAEWGGSDWAFASPEPWFHVGLPDRTDWRWDTTLGTPAWVQWLGSSAVAGPVNLFDPASRPGGVLRHNDFARLKGRFWQDTGSANAIVITPVPAITAYEVGQYFLVKTNFANTGPVTINVNGLGPKNVLDQREFPLPSGYFAAGTMILVAYDGGSFRLMAGAKPLITPLSTEYNTSQNLANSVETTLTLGSASYPQIGTLSGTTFTFNRPGNYMLSADATLTVSTVNANDISGKLLVYNNGAPAAGGGNVDRSHISVTGTTAFNLTSTTPITAVDGTAITVKATVTANNNFTSGACSRVGFAVWPMN